jgi:hypothetical protein
VICVLSCKVFYFPNCFWDTPLQCLQPIWWGIRLTLFCFFVPDSNNIHAQGVVGEITLYILPRGWRCICDTAPALTPVASSGRLWHFDTTWSSPFQQNYEDISYTFRCTFGEYFWMVGWQTKKSKACVGTVLPLYLRLDIPSNLSRALSCLRLSGHNFLVQRMRHDRNRRPYELRICDRCDWHTIQDEEHILLDCPHEHLVRLRTQQQLIFPPQCEDGPARLRTLMNQPDDFGVASFVAKCLALFPWFF